MAEEPDGPSEYLNLPDAVRLIEDGTDAAQLAMKHQDYWSGHPDYPVRDWRHEVADDDTRMGYWHWVANKILEEEGNASA